VISCDRCVELRALPGIPLLKPGDDLGCLIQASLAAESIVLRQGDILVVASKAVSRVEGRFIDVSTVEPSARAHELALETAKDPRVVELILRESEKISRKAPGALVVRHRLGFVTGDAGIDFSNAAAPDGLPGTGPWALLLPVDPDASAERLRQSLAAEDLALGVVISDSFGRPFRLGTVGVALGLSGLPALCDQRGRVDLFGRVLEHTVTAFADQVAAAADLVAGQAAEARPVVHVRGLRFPSSTQTSRDLQRPLDRDLYA
jgi:coenzyme F420-0:L-glutamate ligase/coenzyme F420-1:gamma-L-glutamate ligase